MKSVVSPLNVSRLLQVYEAAAPQLGIWIYRFRFQEYVSITQATRIKGAGISRFSARSLANQNG